MDNHRRCRLASGPVLAQPGPHGATRAVRSGPARRSGPRRGRGSGTRPDL